MALPGAAPHGLAMARTQGNNAVGRRSSSSSSVEDSQPSPDRLLIPNSGGCAASKVLRLIDFSVAVPQEMVPCSSSSICRTKKTSLLLYRRLQCHRDMADVPTSGNRSRRPLCQQLFIVPGHWQQTLCHDRNMLWNTFSHDSDQLWICVVIPASCAASAASVSGNLPAHHAAGKPAKLWTHSQGMAFSMAKRPRLGIGLGSI